MPTAAEQFQEIIEEAISKADQVECPMEDFAEGLGDMISELQTRRQGVLEEMS